MLESYNTVKQDALAEQVIDKSRFIALVSHVNNVIDFEKKLQKTKLEFPNARHYVYAYRLYNGRLEKSSDDGEPQGTGGRPILELLQYRQLWDVQIIVVRYFGGILLGTGGLTRAYGGTARLALDQAGITRLVPNITYQLQIPYPWYEQIKYGFRQKGWEYGEEQFGEQISLNVYIPETEAASFEKWLTDLTKKQVGIQNKGILLRPEQ
ncbi:MAG TPA: YigZ family protein [Peptococcaceae bacterium]|nr:YigZ family protein [Peptococcaceae bacterium]